MISIGLVLILLGLLFPGAQVLFSIGLVLLIVGLIANFTPLGGPGRRRWY